MGHFADLRPDSIFLKNYDLIRKLLNEIINDFLIGVGEIKEDSELSKYWLSEPAPIPNIELVYVESNKIAKHKSYGDIFGVVIYRNESGDKLRLVGYKLFEESKPPFNPICEEEIIEVEIDNIVEGLRTIIRWWLEKGIKVCLDYDMLERENVNSPPQERTTKDEDYVIDKDDSMNPQPYDDAWGVDLGDGIWYDFFDGEDKYRP